MPCAFKKGLVKPVWNNVFRSQRPKGLATRIQIDPFKEYLKIQVKDIVCWIIYLNSGRSVRFLYRILHRVLYRYILSKTELY